MPLTKRLQSEVKPEWQLHVIKYKELQREAEVLVGDENEELEHVFKFHITHAAEEAAEFYNTQLQIAQDRFESVARAVQGVSQINEERIVKPKPPPKPQSLLSLQSPTTSTDQIWAVIEQRKEQIAAEMAAAAEEASSAGSAERVELATYFHTWAGACKEKKNKVFTLFDFVDDSFMSQLEEDALKNALLDWLRLLTLLDEIRIFAILNVAAVLKLAQRHCSASICAGIVGELRALPMCSMVELSKIIVQMEEVAGTLSDRLAKAYSFHLDTTSTWSPHLCPFCCHTVCNAVMLPEGGKACCWACAVENCSNAIIECPLTHRESDVRTLKVERVLGTFLRRFFPVSYKSAPGELLGKVVEKVEEEKTAIGILSSMRSKAKLKPLTIPENGMEKPKSRSARSKSARSPPGSGGVDLSYLDSAVSKMLKNLSDMKNSPSPAIGRSLSGRVLQSDDLGLGQQRDRSSSMPLPPTQDELSDMCRPTSWGNKSKDKIRPSPKAGCRNLASLVAELQG
mmetsp:Transcript_23233/g.36335  ORF Transcript_23233/g.36335 Transcript_23233/m.36335 type:complete len:512 (-) Transcript_23233:665-2200(-)